METPFNVCGGMQDNYDWCGPSAVRIARGISNDDWYQVQGGDGFVAIPDPRDSRIVYSESQDGNMTRKNKSPASRRASARRRRTSTPAPASGAYRFNWDTPMIFSPHDPGVLLRRRATSVFRSTDRGDSWTAISPDLTSNAEPRRTS